MTNLKDLLFSYWSGKIILLPDLFSFSSHFLKTEDIVMSYLSFPLYTVYTVYIIRLPVYTEKAWKGIQDYKTVYLQSSS